MLKQIICVALCAALAALAPSAWAQAPVSLSEDARDRLASAGRTPVIVMLEDPASSINGAASDSQLEQHTESIAHAQNSIVQGVFDRSLGELRSARDSFDNRIASGLPEGTASAVPVLTRAFQFTPAIAMNLSQDEIVRMASMPGVSRIVEDSFNDAVMDESLPLIGATLLHNESLTGEGVAVAIVDTGTDIDHPMFTGKTLTSACFSSYTAETTSRCPAAGATEIGPRAGDSCERCDIANIHGTHVAGTAVGAPFTTTIDETERTLSGVAPGAFLVPVNVFSNYDGDTTALDSDIIAGLEWLYANRSLTNPEGGDPIPLVAINMSLGGGRHFDYCYTDPRAPIISLLRSAGVATVIASGNERYNDSVAAPACIPDATTVGATDRNDEVVSFSNSFYPVDLLAPGVGIRSATDVVAGSPPGAVALNGTSMATPHVAGAFALLASAFPDASVTDIEQALRLSGRPVTDPDNGLTRPRINVAAARDYLTDLASREGPITMTPQMRYFASININRPEAPDAAIYEIRNSGSSAVTLTVETVDNNAIMFGEGVRSFSVELLAGEGFDVGVLVDLAEVPLGTLSGFIRVTAPWQGGEQRIDIPATVLGYAGPTASQRPLNDNFSGATLLSDTSLTLSATTYGATVQAGEPDHDGEETQGSIWYAIETLRDGRIRVAMEGRLGRNTVAVYRGNAIAALQEIASESTIDDDVFLTFEGEEDETYYVAIDYAPPPNAIGGEEQQSFNLTIEPLVGDYDAFESALELTAPGGTGLVSFAGSTVQNGESAVFDPAFSGTIWMHVTGNTGDRFRLSAAQLTQVTFFNFFSGNTLDTLTEVHNASASSYRPFETSVEIPDGGLYISAQQFGTPSATERAGELLFQWQIGPAPEFAQVAGAIAPMARAVRANGLTTALAAAAVGGSIDATECGIVPERGAPLALRFMPLSPTHSSNGDPADIAAGATQIYAFGGRFAAPGAPGILNGLDTISMQVLCENGASNRNSFLSRFHVSVASGPTADMVASIATIDPSAAIVDENGAARFAVAAVNLGDAEQADIYAVPVTIADSEALDLLDNLTFLLQDAALGFPISQALPIDIGICQTDDSGACFNGGEFQSVVELGNVRPGETRTLTVRLTGQGEPIEFAPASNRIVIAFVQVGGFELENWGHPRLVGMTSVAVRTTPTSP